MKNFVLALSMICAASCGSNKGTSAGGTNNDSALTSAPKPKVEIPVTGACTPDVNQWGHPSVCTCPANYKYDAKKFVCGLSQVSACTNKSAAVKARTITDAIATANGLDKSTAREKIDSDADYFLVRVSYDTGLSVPAYTVKLAKDSCFITSVTYTNLEG